jgi:hypothetical protein
MKRAARYASANCERTIVEEPRSPIPHQFSSSQVLVRFIFRLGLVSTFATFSPEGFGTVFAALLALSAIFCAVVGILRRESIFGPMLTHWDEAAACAVLGHLVVALS